MTIGAPKAIVDESLDAPRFNTMFDKYQQLALELTAIKDSTSWRLTAPLRSGADYWMRISAATNFHLNKPKRFRVDGG
jgi:hypothetical protein